MSLLYYVYRYPIVLSYVMYIDALCWLYTSTPYSVIICYVYRYKKLVIINFRTSFVEICLYLLIIHFLYFFLDVIFNANSLYRCKIRLCSLFEFCGLNEKCTIVVFKLMILPTPLNADI